MRRTVALALALLLLLAACGGDEESAGTDTTETHAGTDTQVATDGNGTTTDGGNGGPRCARDAGMVLGYVPQVQRDACDPRDLLRGETLYGADQVTTGTVGQLEFSAGRLDLCTTWPGTVIVVRPDDETLLRLVNGTVACTAQPGGEERIDVPGAEIEVTGTLFTLEAAGDETTIRVHEGSLDVTPTGVEAPPAEVEGGQQVVAADGREPTRVTYAIGAAESERLTALRLRVVTLPAEALGGFTSGAGSESTLVTATEEQGEFLLQNAVVRSAQAITPATLRQRSQIKLAGDVVVGVGTFSELEDAFARLRQRLGPDATIVYAPYSFGETTTTGTTETTETATTETTDTTEPTDTTETTAPTPTT